MNTKPAGKPWVWLIVGLIAAFIIGMIIVNPRGQHRAEQDQPLVGMATTPSDVQGSAVPGAANNAGEPVTNPNATAAPQR